MDIQERFDSKWQPEPNSGCWLWLGCLDANGYGAFRMLDKTWRAHRVAYEIYKGFILDGLTLDHICRVRCCVNPDHLEAVTHQENMRRGDAGKLGRERQLAKTHCPQGHPYDQENTFINKSSCARSCRACRRFYSSRYYWERGGKEHYVGSTSKS